MMMILMNSTRLMMWKQTLAHKMLFHSAYDLITFSLSSEIPFLLGEIRNFVGTRRQQAKA